MRVGAEHSRMFMNLLSEGVINHKAVGYFVSTSLLLEVGAEERLICCDVSRARLRFVADEKVVFDWHSHIGLVDVYIIRCVAGRKIEKGDVFNQNLSIELINHSR